VGIVKFVIDWICTCTLSKGRKFIMMPRFTKHQICHHRHKNKWSQAVPWTLLLWSIVWMTCHLWTWRVVASFLGPCCFRLQEERGGPGIFSHV